MIEVKQIASEELRREFVVTISEDIIQKRVNVRLIEVGRDARIPGFRPGKAPVLVLQKRFGEQARAHVLQALLNESRDKAIKDHDLRPARAPQLEEVAQEEGLSFKLVFDLLPVIALPDPKTLKIERPVIKASEDLVTERLEELSATLATFHETDAKEKAVLRDKLVVDFSGELDDGRKPDEMKSEGLSVVLGAATLIDGLEQGLIGTKVGQTKKITVDMPENSPFGEHKATFTCIVKSIERAQMPSIDEDFAKSLGMESLTKLREAVERQVQQRLDGICRNQAKQTLLDDLADKATFTIPEFLLTGEIDSVNAQLARENQNDEDVVDKDEVATLARRRISLGLMFTQYAQENDIIVSEDELNRAVMAQAQSRPNEQREVIEFFQKNPAQRENLRGPILEEKVVDWILDLAKVSEREVTLEALQKEADKKAAAQAEKNQGSKKKIVKKKEVDKKDDKTKIEKKASKTPAAKPDKKTAT